MSVTVESPVKRWQGRVVLTCPVSLEPYRAWRDAIAEVNKISGESTTMGEVANDPELLRHVLPGICAMVEKWEIGGDFPQNITPESFPFIPRIPSLKMIIWLMSEISKIIAIEDDLPLT
jgi:hypothetical protein